MIVVAQMCVKYIIGDILLCAAYMFVYSPAYPKRDASSPLFLRPEFPSWQHQESIASVMAATLLQMHLLVAAAVGALWSEPQQFVCYLRLLPMMNPWTFDSVQDRLEFRPPHHDCCRHHWRRRPRRRHCLLSVLAFLK